MKTTKMFTLLYLLAASAFAQGGSRSSISTDRPGFRGGFSMDFVFILLIAALIALSWGFVRLCGALEPLMPRQEERK